MEFINIAITYRVQHVATSATELKKTFRQKARVVDAREHRCIELFFVFLFFFFLLYVVAGVTIRSHLHVSELGEESGHPWR